MCHTMLEHIIESLGTQVTQHPNSNTQGTQHVKFAIPSGCGMPRRHSILQTWLWMVLYGLTKF
jgi:hypothetical protein